MSEQELLNRIKELEEENKRFKNVFVLNMEKELDLLFELEGAESYLDDDIQALEYIQEELDTIRDGKKDVLDIFEIRNRVQILLKSMLYNQNGMKNAIDRAYEEKRATKEGVA